MVVFLVVNYYTYLNLKWCSFFMVVVQDKIKWEFGSFDPLPMKGPDRL